MSPFKPINRDTNYLFPPSINDWLPEQHLARFVVDIVEQLEFNALLPELSTSAQPLTGHELKNIVDSPCTTLFVARNESRAVVGSLTLVTFRTPSIWHI